MLLFIHIASALAAFGGSVAASLPFFSRRKAFVRDGFSKSFFVLFAQLAVFMGIAGTIISGFFLARGNASILSSDAFVANMAVFVVLIGAEVGFFWARGTHHAFAFRLVSFISWIWIFSVLWFDIEAPFFIIIFIYFITILLSVIVLKSVFTA